MGNTTMRQKLATAIGTLMIAGGLLGASLTGGAGGLSVEAQEATPPAEEQSDAHERMHKMMGAGASEQMHAAMPESEEMMDACAAGMGEMMNGMGEMMNGMDEMPMRDTHDADGTPSTEED